MIVFVIAVGGFILAAYLLFQKNIGSSRNSKISPQKGKNLPPGPPQLPFLGNTHQMDFHRMHETFDEWSREYGDIVYARIVNKDLVVLNSYDVIKEALVRHGDNFTARPEFYIFLAIRDGAGYFGSDGPLWKEQRQHGQHLLRDFGVGRRMQEEKIAVEAADLFAQIETGILSGENFRTWNPVSDIKFATVNIINNILFGKRFAYGDPESLSFHQVVMDSMHLTNQQFPMEFIPFLRKFPRLFNQAECKRKMKELFDYCRIEVEQHKETLAADSANGEPSDFVFGYLQEIEKRKSKTGDAGTFSEAQLVQNLVDLFFAGFETTATTMCWFLVYMINYPDIQEKMRREIQENLGGQSPGWSDRTKLPYSNAVIAETQRVGNIVPFGIFHSCYQDAVLNGYRVPRGSIVCVNHWSAMRDERVFKNPQVFNPSRFISPEDGTFSEGGGGFIPFSIGKRACMGEGLARMELFIFATAIVSRYRLKAPPTGVPTLEPVADFTLAPKPFQATFEKID